MNPERISMYGIILMRYSVPCSNFCRFCSVGFKRFDDVPLQTFAEIAHRFLRWKEETPSAPGIFCATQYTHAYMTEEQLLILKSLSSQGKYAPLPLQMNGCRFMPEDDLRDLFARHKRAGEKDYCITVCGNRKLHDSWVGRRGEYDSFFRMARVAAEQGWRREEKLFLSKSSIPCLREVMQELDTLPGEKTRRIFPFCYVGNARNLENERITDEDLAEVPPEAYSYMDIEKRPGYPAALRGYQPEQAWADELKDLQDGDEPLEQCLLIRVDSESIPRLLQEDCGAIYSEYLNRSVEIFRKLPEIRELCRMYGDKENRRLYTDYEIKRKWVERYMRENLWEEREKCCLNLF